MKRFFIADASDAFLDEFDKEVVLMRTLRSPYVLQFLGSAVDPPNNICIVTEFMARGSLHDLLHNAAIPLSWELLLAMLQDAARGMTYLHTCSPPIIHRDLKSHNLLVDEFWRCKVADFGLSTVAAERNATMPAAGTPCWAAPEVLGHMRCTTKADVYSYGIVLWECLTRQDPFAGLPAFKVMAVVSEGGRPPIPAWCPYSYAQLMRRCWKQAPDARPEFSEIIPALKDVADEGWNGTPGDGAQEEYTSGAASVRSIRGGMSLVGPLGEELVTEDGGEGGCDDEEEDQ